MSAPGCSRQRRRHVSVHAGRTGAAVPEQHRPMDANLTNEIHALPGLSSSLGGPALAHFGVDRLAMFVSSGQNQKTFGFDWVSASP